MSIMSVWCGRTGSKEVVVQDNPVLNGFSGMRVPVLVREPF